MSYPDMGVDFTGGRNGMKFKTVKRKSNDTPKIIFHGPSSIGKTTFGASLPNPLFLDLEDSASHIVVTQLEDFDLRRAPASQTLEVLEDLAKDPKEFQSVVIDTFDALERKVSEELANAKFQGRSLGEIDWGKGWAALTQEMEHYFHIFNAIADQGIIVCLLCHSELRRVESPLVNPYDSFDLKLSKKVSPLAIEWANLVLFSQVRVFQSQDKRGKVVTKGNGQRVVYTETRPAFVAKNRLGLPLEMPFEKEGLWSEIVKYMQGVL
jgi:hypothetical protein